MGKLFTFTRLITSGTDTKKQIAIDSDAVVLVKQHPDDEKPQKTQITLRKEYFAEFDNKDLPENPFDSIDEFSDIVLRINAAK
jgi:hypothetical protein